MTTMTQAPANRSIEQPIRQAGSRRQTWITVIFAIVIFIPCIFGFGTKFLELVNLSHSDQEGRFALTPVVNYLLATMGFLCMFLWGATRGTFHNVEAAKQKMLDDDELIEKASR